MPVRMAGKEYLQIQEAARLLGISRQTLQRWFREGKAEDVGRDRRGWRVFSPADIDRLRKVVDPLS